MNWARAIPFALAVIAACPALAQSPSAPKAAPAPPAALGESAKAMIGSWEFSNADRDKICTATFKSQPGAVGFKVEFDANCDNLFPFVNTVVGWRFPDNDNLFLMDATGKTLAEFSEVESGIFEAPTPGVGVLFLQNAAAAGPPPKPPEQVAGNWAITRGGTPICTVTLATTPLRDGFTLTVKPGCDAATAKLNFTQWSLDRGELLLTPARGNPWRFEEGDGGAWRRIPESSDAIALVRQ
jgi:hypothetical protein